MKKVLITGANGQIGSELTERLRCDLGVENVVATDITTEGMGEGIYEVVDVMDYERLKEVVEKYKVDTIVHLAALLSATAENNPLLGWNLNMTGLMNNLEISREYGLKLFSPSSIAVFGSSSPKDKTPQDTIMRPSTMYGVTKVAGELLCDYYNIKYDVDTRSVRYPGLISYKTLPGGGTTDYAVHIYYDALKYGKYTSFIAKDTQMDMMFMDDAIEATIKLLMADREKLVHKNGFNITAMSFTPEEIANSIRKFIPEFEISYDVDPLREKIAESWPNSLDATCAKKEWNFDYKYDLDKMSEIMLTQIAKKLGDDVKVRLLVKE